MFGFAAALALIAFAAPGRGSVAQARLIFVDKGKMLRMEGAGRCNRWR